MKKVLLLFLVCLFACGSAYATQFTLDSYDVELNTSDPGLVVYWEPILSSPHSFELNSVGDSVTLDIFKLGTNETWAFNSDDRVAQDITAIFNFSSPDLVAVDRGSTDGRWFIIDYGVIEWGAPISFSFGTEGMISLDLEDDWFLAPGFTTISGTITLTSEDTAAPTAAPVPEPATMVLMGIGLVGLAGVSRKKCRKKQHVI